jgi:threonyl-tRNA synthetase
MSEPFSEEDLAKIEVKMREIIQRDEPFIRQELSKKEAAELFKRLNEDYKLDLIREIPDEGVSVYKTGKDFIDLCRGPHVESTGEIKAFKLLSVAGAYWHGIETNPMLQRIYGTCFENQKDLEEHLHNLEEAKNRDHRKLGPQLEFTPTASPTGWIADPDLWDEPNIVRIMDQAASEISMQFSFLLAANPRTCGL